MLKHLAENDRTYVTMDNTMARELAQSDPVLFFQTYKPPVLIDEVQKAPELFEQIKIICDESDEKGLVWLTGSQQYNTEAGGITDAVRFRKFLVGCASLVSEQVNYSTLAESADIAPSTAKEWLKILVGLNIIYLLAPYSNNELKRLSKTPKLYFCDTGLCSYLSMWLTPDTLRNGAASGHYYENYVVMELVKNYAYAKSKVNLTYFRDSNAKEINVFVEENNVIHPLEIKKSAAPDRREVKKYNVIDKASLKRGNGGIICMCEEPIPIDSDNCFNMEACFAEKSQFLPLRTGSAMEFYNELAMFRPENSSQTFSDVIAWWDYYRRHFDSDPREELKPLELDSSSQETLRHIDQMCLQSWLYPKETTVFLTCYNPFFLVDNRTYPLEETRFEDRNDSSGFINATPYGVPINILEEMLLAGMLLDDDPQTLSERIRELRSRPNRQEWDG